LAEGLGCRQQTISEWELGMYGPKNAYQKLLTMFFGSAPVIAENVPSQSVWGNGPDVSAAALAGVSADPLTPAEKN
jgi:hypothetical protein